jgi:ketosteroid isomerase-like protein
MTTIHDLANDLVAICRTGDFHTPGEKYWADNVRSIEAQGDSPLTEGKAAAQAKGQWWTDNHEVHGTEVEGPYVNGDQFVVRFKMDVTFKPSGQRTQMDEMAVHTVADGKIVEERFFYG